MFAVILVGGKQYKVAEKDELRIEKVDLEEGEKLDIKEVLLVGEDDGENVKIGEPYVSGAHVECEVMEQGRGKKIKVFKMKAKKRYSKTQGHRQSYTLIKVLKISALEKKAAKKPAAKKEEVKEEVKKD
ncbi:MAG: large subunit ribosomal protein L21 [Oceanicoccus sp.]|jgi:large subunit ribosomal protein L21